MLNPGIYADNQTLIRAKWIQTRPKTHARASNGLEMFSRPTGRMIPLGQSGSSFLGYRSRVRQRGRFPDLHRSILAGRGNPVTVGAERHTLDRARMAVEGADLLGRAIPYLYR